LSLSLMVLAGVTAYVVQIDAAPSPSRLMRVTLLSLSLGLAGYLLVAAGGLRLEALPGGTRLWPGGWNVGYQAPLISFALAMVPVLPSLARAAGRLRAVRRADRLIAPESAHGLPRGEDRQEEEQANEREEP
jgi:hypothetical protein